MKWSSPSVGWIVARLWASSPSVFLTPDCKLTTAWASYSLAMMVTMLHCAYLVGCIINFLGWVRVRLKNNMLLNSKTAKRRKKIRNFYPTKNFNLKIFSVEQNFWSKKMWRGGQKLWGRGAKFMVIALWSIWSLHTESWPHTKLRTLQKVFGGRWVEDPQLI